MQKGMQKDDGQKCKMGGKTMGKLNGDQMQAAADKLMGVGWESEAYIAPAMPARSASLAEKVRHAVESTGKIQVSNHAGKRRHMTARFDADGPYVRTGKRGQCKQRIEADLNCGCFWTFKEAN